MFLYQLVKGIVFACMGIYRIDYIISFVIYTVAALHDERQFIIYNLK